LACRVNSASTIPLYALAHWDSLLLISLRNLRGACRPCRGVSSSRYQSHPLSILPLPKRLLCFGGQKPHPRALLPQTGISAQCAHRCCAHVTLSFLKHHPGVRWLYGDLALGGQLGVEALPFGGGSHRPVHPIHIRLGGWWLAARSQRASSFLVLFVI